MCVASTTAGIAKRATSVTLLMSSRKRGRKRRLFADIGVGMEIAIVVMCANSGTATTPKRDQLTLSISCATAVSGWDTTLATVPTSVSGASPTTTRGRGVSGVTCAKPGVTITRNVPIIVQNVGILLTIRRNVPTSTIATRKRSKGKALHVDQVDIFFFFFGEPWSTFLDAEDEEGDFLLSFVVDFGWSLVPSADVGFLASPF